MPIYRVCVLSFIVTYFYWLFIMPISYTSSSFIYRFTFLDVRDKRSNVFPCLGKADGIYNVLRVRNYPRNCRRNYFTSLRCWLRESVQLCQFVLRFACHLADKLVSCSTSSTFSISLSSPLLSLLPVFLALPPYSPCSLSSSPLQLGL